MPTERFGAACTLFESPQVAWHEKAVGITRVDMIIRTSTEHKGQRVIRSHVTRHLNARNNDEGFADVLQEILRCITAEDAGSAPPCTRHLFTVTTLSRLAERVFRW